MSASAEHMPASWKVWLLAARPKTLFAGIAPVLAGAAMAAADGAFHGLAALCALFGAVFIQIGTNYANDYFDFVKGTDTESRLGPLRVTQAGLATPAQMKTATTIAFGLATLAGGYLVYRGGWPIVVIGALSILFGVLYTGGPYPLGYLGLGDVFVLVFFGPVAVGGTYYVQALTVTPAVLVAGLAPGLLSTAILTVNNLRDIEGDRAAGKKTPPARFGRGFARAEYIACVVLACVAVPAGLCVWTGGHWLALAACLALIAAIPNVRAILREEGPALNQTLAGTGKITLLYSVLFSAGWLL
ncbi:MAG TPA: 1,4-dihydroxy-2-naphthoate polyprenyltransferase [Candidatus Hydrogenedentes bacterium]|nr:1,4-dihydroxy-2-naphthoate polyprenyltransferase [Candidatus Hydrogenedentota bacterium]